MNKKRMYVVPEMQTIVLKECLLATVSGEDPIPDFSRKYNVREESYDEEDILEWEK